MQTFRTNPPSRAVPPRALLAPSSKAAGLPRENAELLAALDQYAARHHIAPSTVGRRIVNSARLMDELRDGVRPRAGRCEKIRAFLAREAANA